MWHYEATAAKRAWHDGSDEGLRPAGQGRVELGTSAPLVTSCWAPGG